MTDLETSLLNAGAINDLLEKTVRRRVNLHADMGKQLKKWRDSSGMLGKEAWRDCSKPAGKEVAK